MAGEFTPAKRGDLVAVVSARWNGNTSHTQVDIAIVTSITREGEIKAWRNAWGTVEQRRHAIYDRLLVVPAADADVEAAFKAAQQHTFPGSSQPMPFDSVEEIKDFVQPFRRGQQ